MASAAPRPPPDDLAVDLRSKSAFFGPDGAKQGAAAARGALGGRAADRPRIPAHPSPAKHALAAAAAGEVVAAVVAVGEGAVPPPLFPAYDASTPFSHRAELYRGAVSTILAARCPVTGRPVILKEYERVRMKAKHVARVAREVAAMTALADLPAVVRLHARFDDEVAGRITLVVEHCTGGDLFRALVLARGAGLGARYAAASVVAPLLRTLVVAHSRGILHRDIKPENLFVGGDGAVKLGDFGLAIDSRSELPFSRSGTLDYMAPEVLANPALADVDEGPGVTRAALAARGARPYGPAVDVWAVGVLAYELVTGRPPFDGGDEAATAARVLYSDALDLPRAHGAEWAAFVRAALAKRPGDRPTTARLLDHAWLALHGCAGGGGDGAATRARWRRVAAPARLALFLGRLGPRGVAGAPAPRRAPARVPRGLCPPRAARRPARAGRLVPRRRLLLLPPRRPRPLRPIFCRSAAARPGRWRRRARRWVGRRGGRGRGARRVARPRRALLSQAASCRRGGGRRRRRRARRRVTLRALQPDPHPTFTLNLTLTL